MALTNKKQLIKLFSLIFIVCVIFADQTTFAANNCPKLSLAQIEPEVMCLVCGTPLNVAQAPQAQRERIFIKKLIAQCKDKKEIKKELVNQYGTAVLTSPSQTGLSNLANGFPIVTILIAVLALFLIILRWRKKAQ